ncbi:hypothetical protein C1X72_01275 [Pseudomonas sp. FW306-2-2C-D06B]|nr:hypothetical protein C1X72_01275 [Pseudomonas sp. FW306-2-2C-D06B]
MFGHKWVMGRSGPFAGQARSHSYSTAFGHFGSPVGAGLPLERARPASTLLSLSQGSPCPAPS